MKGGCDGIAIITGAAGGMGRAIATAFAEAGRPILLADLRREPLDEMALALGQKVWVDIVSGDISASDYAAKLLAALGGRPISVLAHAAGVSPSMADGQRIFEINFNATRRLVETLLPHMPGGVAVLIASNSGQIIARPLFDRAVKRMIAGKRPLLGSLMLRSAPTDYPSRNARCRSMPRPCRRRSARLVHVSCHYPRVSSIRRWVGSKMRLAPKCRE